ncbi:DsbA family protein [Candidatus Woesebacteria bacterium]|nr:DsbA family protein [Candidatus Woesebacteria bacterium]MCD8506733.1 DsbA family protein [Candidatus Woesebacteria bacterium]
MIEYSDYECPFCKNFHETMVQVMEEYDGQVRWVFRHYPLSFHEYAEPVAQASECVAELGGNDAFWAFTDAYFARTEATGTGFPQEDVAALAAEVAGVNAGAVQECIDSGKYADNIADEMAAGAAAGVSGTPGTILVTADGETELISGALPFTQVKTIIDGYLE